MTFLGLLLYSFKKGILYPVFGHFPLLPYFVYSHALFIAMKQRFSSLDVKVSLWKASPNFHGGNAKYFKVITHELSNALCTLRLANIYDLSSV